MSSHPPVVVESPPEPRVLGVFKPVPLQNPPAGMLPQWSLTFPASAVSDDWWWKGELRAPHETLGFTATSARPPVVSVETGARERAWRRLLQLCDDCNVSRDWAFTGMAVQAVVQPLDLPARALGRMSHTVTLALVAVRPVGDLSDVGPLRGRICAAFEAALEGVRVRDPAMDDRVAGALAYAKTFGGENA